MELQHPQEVDQSGMLALTAITIASVRGLEHAQTSSIVDIDEVFIRGHCLPVCTQSAVDSWNVSNNPDLYLQLPYVVLSVCTQPAVDPWNVSNNSVLHLQHPMLFSGVYPICRGPVRPSQQFVSAAGPGESM